MFAVAANRKGAAAVSGNISSASFGQIISADAPRLLQWAAKFYF